MKRRFVGFVALILIAAPPLRAQDDPEGDRPTSRLIEEIVVTAQKREESLQDVPISIQAFSDDKLDALGIFNQNDLQQIVPTLNISSVLAFTIVYLRGIGTDAYLTADPSVATYIDGIYFPFAAGLSQDFGVLERIEVLKGPQGTLFGRNATGGALNIITRDPLLGELDAQANVTVANYPELHVKGYASIPFGETVALSVSPIYSETDFYLENTANPMSKDRAAGVRAKLRWAPTDWMDAILAGLKIKSDTPSTSLLPGRTATDLAVLLGADREQYRLGSNKAAVDGCCEQDLDNTVIYGNVSFFTPWFDVKLLGSTQDIDTETLLDFDGTATPVLTLDNDGYDAEVHTAELQVKSNEDTWGSDWLKWIVGGYYFDGLAGYEEPDRLEGSLGVDDVVSEPVLDLLGLEELPAGDKLFVTTLVATDSIAAFAQGTLTFTEWLDLTFGIRYQDEGRELLRSQVGALIGDEEVIIFDDSTAQRQDGSTVGPTAFTQTWSPKISVETRPFGDDALFYLSYQEATKSGTYNGLRVTGPPTFADPESITAWELGSKLSLLHGTLQFNGALFHYDIDDLQVQFVSLSTGGSVAFENAEEARIRGLDFDLTWLIAPHLVEGLVLVGGMGWLETAEYVSYPNARGYVDNSGIAQNNANFSGNRIVKTPEISGNVALSKTWFFGDHELELGGDMYYTDEFFYEPSNRKLNQQPAYTLWGARVSYYYEPWHVRVSVFGRNLTDEAYTRGVQPADFSNPGTVGAPRTYGMRLAWHY